MGRPAKITAIVFGIFVFLSISALLARALAGAGNERAKVLRALEAQAAGDVRGVLAELDACRTEPACADQVRRRTAQLRRPGEVEILRYDPSVKMPLTRSQGTARVAWRTDRVRAPVVQCLKIRRDGPLTGSETQLLTLSAPIAPTGSC